MSRTSLEKANAKAEIVHWIVKRGLVAKFTELRADILSSEPSSACCSMLEPGALMSLNPG